MVSSGVIFGKPRRHFTTTRPSSFPLSSRMWRRLVSSNGVLPTRFLSSLSRSTTIPTSRILSTTSVPLPSNLTFDHRSSFAPSVKGGVKKRGPSALPRIPVPNDQVEDDYETRAKNNNDAHTTSRESSELDDFQDKDDGEIEEELYTMTTPYLPKGMTYAIPLPERLHVNVYTLFAPEYDSQVGTIHLDEHVWGKDPIRIDLLKRAVDYYRAHARGRRKAKTKTISEVSGSGKKMRQQKGTGMARAGHKRPPHWRGGAKAHGPKNNTDYANYKLNKKVRKQALMHALSQKLLEGNLLVVDRLHDLPTHKTRDLQRLLQPWSICTGGGVEDYSALLLDHYYPENDKMPEAHRGMPANVWVAGQNLHRLAVGNTHRANVYDILKHDKLIVTLEAMQELERRLKPSA